MRLSFRPESQDPVYARLISPLCWAAKTWRDVWQVVPAGSAAAPPREPLRRPVVPAFAPAARVVPCPPVALHLRWAVGGFHRSCHHCSPFFASFLIANTPKPIGASAGLSTAPLSAICRNKLSFDCLKLGRVNTTTPSARSPGPSLRRLKRNSVTGSCSLVPHRL